MRESVPAMVARIHAAVWLSRSRISRSRSRALAPSLQCSKTALALPPPAARREHTHAVVHGTYELADALVLTRSSAAGAGARHMGAVPIQKRDIFPEGENAVAGYIDRFQSPVASEQKVRGRTGRSPKAGHIQFQHDGRFRVVLIRNCSKTVVSRN